MRSETGDIKPFRGGIGMIASRLDVPVVPVRLDGVDRVLHHEVEDGRPGPVRVAFGAPLRLRGDDYAALARSRWKTQCGRCDEFRLVTLHD